MAPFQVYDSLGAYTIKEDFRQKNDQNHTTAHEDKMQTNQQTTITQTTVQTHDKSIHVKLATATNETRRYEVRLLLFQFQMETLIQNKSLK